MQHRLQPENTSVPEGSRAQHLPGLDGLRALAVAAVVLYHSEFRWARGGYLGVDLFFVISGFLITYLLSGEVDRTGGLDLRGFYWRRAKRLLPASWLMTAAAICAAWLFAPDALQRLRSDALASLVYVTNWELLSAKVSYFESIGRQPLLLHLWSLAIEEQFYILWAPLLVIGMNVWGRRRLALGAALLALGMVGWTFYLATLGGYLVHTTATRLDFGTDTHSYPLLIGAVLGLLWRPEPQTDHEREDGGHGVFSLGLIALGVVIYLLASMGEETPGLYPWGFLAAALASATLIAAATYGGSYFGRWLDQQPLRWLGERSYGVYLWHWPIFMLLRPEDLHLNPLLIFAIRITLTLLFASVSYRFVETPIRRGLLERIAQGLATPGRRLAALASAVGVLAALALLFTPLVALWRVKASDLASAAAEASAPPKPTPQASIKAKAPVRPPKVFTGEDVTVLGDSVLLGSARAFERALPGVRIDAHVGWQARDVVEELRTLDRSKALRPVVVIHLGTNGYVYEPQLRDMLQLLSSRERVVVVNSHVPRRWMEANNALFDRVAPEFRNAVLVDWRKTSEGQDGYFVADGFHLTPSGQTALVSLILREGRLAPAASPSTETVEAAGASSGKAGAN